jgi:RNA polymerase sigma-70 factor (ECF subfamily)
MNQDGSGEPLAAGVVQEICALYEKDAPGMLRYAARVARNQEAAQDAVQEAFLRLFIARSAGQQIRQPRAWLFRVLHNHVLDQERAGSRNDIGLDSLRNTPGPGRTPETDYGRIEALERALGTTLSPREVECVRLRAEGLQYDEIAEALGLRPGTVGALLTRAHKKMRQAAGDAGYTSSGFNLPVAAGKRYAS